MCVYETLIATTGTYANLIPETRVNAGSSSFASLFFGQPFFSTRHRPSPPFRFSLRAILARPFAFAVPPHRTAGTARAAVRYIRGSLCFMANCFIIFDIFPVYGRAGPRRFASRLSIVRDERRFMRAIPDTPGPRDVLFARHTTRVGVERDKRYFLVIKREICARALPRRSGGDQKIYPRHICFLVMQFIFYCIFLYRFFTVDIFHVIDWSN